MYLIRHHKGRIEAEAEMPDNLFLAGLVLIFFQEIRGAGECNLVDVFLYFLGRHAQAVVNELQCLLFRVHQDLDLWLIIFGKPVFPHQIQLLQFGNGVAAVRNQFPVENVVV